MKMCKCKKDVLKICHRLLYAILIIPGVVLVGIAGIAYAPFLLVANVLGFLIHWIVCGTSWDGSLFGWMRFYNLMNYQCCLVGNHNYPISHGYSFNPYSCGGIAEAEEHKISRKAQEKAWRLERYACSFCDVISPKFYEMYPEDKVPNVNTTLKEQLDGKETE